MVTLIESLRLQQQIESITQLLNLRGGVLLQPFSPFIGVLATIKNGIDHNF
jgi:hypothetical protein